MRPMPGVLAVAVLAGSAAILSHTVESRGGEAGGAEAPVKLFPIVKGGKWGYMDDKGKVVIEPQYDGAWDFSEGLACVGVGLLRGYIDRTGAMAITPRFGWAGSFHCGLAAAFGHPDGKPVGARSGDIWGDDVQMYKPQAGMLYVDKGGKVVDGGIACSPVEFSEGKACCQDKCIGTDGKPVKHDAELLRSFSGGLAAARRGGKWGYLDSSMKWAIVPQYDGAGDFGDGLAPVGVAVGGDGGAKGRGKAKGQALKWGYIDKTGKTVIEPRFADAGVFSEGVAPAREGDKWGLVDRSGAVVAKPQYDYAWRCSEGLVRVMAGEKFGYVGRDGKSIVEPRFDSAWEFSRGLARVCVGEKEGYIDHEGKYVWEPTE